MGIWIPDWMGEVVAASFHCFPGGELCNNLNLVLAIP